MSVRWRQVSMTACSMVIFSVLGIQFVAGFVDTGRWGWPFIAYPMYKTAHYDGERLDHDFAVSAITADQQRITIKRQELGMDFWAFHYNVVTPIRNPLYRDRLRPFASLICARLDAAPVALEITDLGVAISRDGPVFGLEPEVLATAEITCE